MSKTSDLKTRDQLSNKLKEIFINKYGIDPGGSLSLWSRYSRKHFIKVRTDKGKTVTLDRRTGKTVTKAYVNQLRGELKKSRFAATSLNSLNINQLGNRVNLLDRQIDFSNAQSRHGHVGVAKPGDKPAFGDRPLYTKVDGKWVVTGGVTQDRKNKALDKARKELSIAESRVNNFWTSKFDTALKGMGYNPDQKGVIDQQLKGTQPRTWQDPYKGPVGETRNEREMREALGVGPYEPNTTGDKGSGKVKPPPVPVTPIQSDEAQNTSDGTPPPQSTTSDTPKKVVKPEENKPTLKSDVFTLDADGNPLGVMTRARRRRWEANNQALMAKNQLQIGDRTYTNKGETLRIGSG